MAQVLPTEQHQDAVMTAASADDRLWVIRRSGVSEGAVLVATSPNPRINPAPKTARPLGQPKDFVIA
jgi:hypothetical protein